MTTFDFELLFSLTPPEGMDPPSISPCFHSSSLAFLESIGRAKSDALKQWIIQHGWPHAHGGSNDAEVAAFTIAHHSDYDLKFQILCHTLMLELVTKGYRRNLGFLAFLTDRILCNQGKHQRFGTQIRETDNGSFVPKPIEDTGAVDGLRAQVGIPENLADYMQRINGGDVMLFRPLVEQYAASKDYQPDPKIIPFPGT